MILLVIDTQKGITNENLYEFDIFKTNVSTLIAEARKNGTEVVFVRHDDGPGSGFSVGDEAFEIYEGFAPNVGEKIFDKSVNSAFHASSGLLKYLKDKDEKTVIAVGLMTDFCMDATIKSGFENGFEMIVPALCNSTMKTNDFMSAENAYRFYNEFMWPERYARCVSFEEALSMIKENKKAEKPADKSGINPCGTLEIETERLLLRRFTYEDTESMMRNWVSDDEVQDMYGEPSYKTPEAVKGLLDKYIGGYKSDNYYRWAVIEKESGECIGQIAYFLVDTDNHFGEIEYCIGTAFQKKGYATEATKAVIAYGFEKINFHKVQICVRPSNLPSKRVIEKCGFTYEGMLRDYFYRHGKYEGRMFYSILRDEWNCSLD